uniref:BRCT domain-containing protein n=1 Tax=Haptolina brevifila TaxID=156173 RepID=A0A7S2CBK1_9EUKA
MVAAAYEMIQGDAFKPAGMTLRFPRCGGFRTDKSWYEAACFEEVEQMFKDGKAKIASSKRSAAEVAQGGDDLKYGGEAGRRNKKPKALSTQRQVKVLPHLRVDLAAIKTATAKIGDALQGLVVLIKGSGGRPGTPTDIESLRKIVIAHGGEISASQTDEVNLIVDADEVSGESIRASVEKAKSEQLTTHNIVRASWLLACNEAVERLPFEPRYMLYTTPDTRESIADKMDRWGDRFTEEATAESLQSAMELVGKEVDDMRRLAARSNDGCVTSLACTTTFTSAIVPASAGGPGTSGVWPVARHSQPTTAMTSRTSNLDSKMVLSAEGAMKKRSAAERQTAQALALNEQLVLKYLNKLPDDDVSMLTSSPDTMLIHGVVAYSPRATVRLRLRLAGASVVDSPTPNTTHAVLPASSVTDGTCADLRHTLTRLRWEAAPSAGPGVNAHLVSEAWLDECQAQGRRADETRFALCEARRA